MAKKNNKVLVGKYAYLIGLLLAVVAGLVAVVAEYAYTPIDTNGTLLPIDPDDDDDSAVQPLMAKFGHPFADSILFHA